jgi:hypothetical protein
LLSLLNISAWLFSETAKCCIFVFVQLSIFVHNIRDSVKVIETYGNKLIAGLKSTGTFFVFIIPMLTLSAANHWFDAVLLFLLQTINKHWYKSNQFLLTAPDQKKFR